ncbi:MAG TPA: O-antigen ligase family protein [Bryobacteraceae bacterium]
METRKGNSAAAVENTTGGIPDLSAASARESSKFGAILVAIYAFIEASRILELSSIYKLHIPLFLFVILALVTLGMLIQRGIHGFLDNKASFCFAALTVWVVISFPLSEWRAVSFPLIEKTIQGLILFVAVAQLGSTEKHWRWIAAGFGYGALCASIVSFFLAKTIVGGRLVIGRGGTLTDPNELALSLVIGLPFLLYTAALSKGLKRIVLYASSILVLYSFARTGSRGGLLALMAMLLVFFILGKTTQKMAMIVACVVGIAAGVVLLPHGITDRFTTFFAVHEDNVSNATESHLDSAVASAEGRKDLLIQSLQITAQHPLLGVGPGVFPTVARHQRVANHQSGGANLVTHNTYTEYSAEAGVLAFVFWTGTLFFCIRYALQAYRSMSGLDDLLAFAARDTLAAMIALAVGSCFLSLAYGLKIPVLLGLTVALHNVVQARRENPKVAETAPALPMLAGSAVLPASRTPLAPRKPRRFDLSGRPRNRY